MAPPVADGDSSSAPTANETPAEAVEVGVGVAVQENFMVVGAVAAVKEPDEVEPEEAVGAEPQEDEEAVEPQEATVTGAEPDDEDAEEDPDEEADDDPEEEEEDEENTTEEVEEASDEDTVVEPLAVLKPGEVQEEDESEETEDEEENEEPSEVDVDGTKGLVHGSAVDGEHVKGGDKDKDEVADILSNDDDAGGSRNGDMQNFELAGGLELLVDELPKNCVEEDIAVVFSECGEIKSVKIIRNSSTEKSKDIAFVCFASIEAANKAVTEFKKGIEVLTTLNDIGIQECKISLPSNYKGKNRGFAFLKFGSHYFARAAFHRLMKPDAIFGIDRSATVSFYRKPTKPSNDLMEAKRVYLEHVPISWNEDKIKECYSEYGKILNIDLFQISKNMKSETFSFVEFSSSKSALACVEGINNAKIFDGSLKDVVVKKNAPSNRLLKDRITSQAAAKLQQISKPSEGERKHGESKNTAVNQRPSNIARNNCNVDGSNLTTYRRAAVLQTSNLSKGKRKPGKDVITYINERPLKKAHNNSNVRRPNRTRGTGQPAGHQYSRAHRSLGESSRSKSYASDLEPHAGYIPSANQVHNTHTYDQRRIGHYGTHPIDVHPYARETALSRPTNSDYKSWAPYETEYEYMYPPPHTSGSYYPGKGPYITRRGDY